MPTRAFLVLVLLAAAGCGSTPTSPSTPATSSSQFFITTLSTGGTGVYTFGLTTDTFIGVTLTSINSVSTGEPLGLGLTLALGTPSGSACTTTTSIATQAHLAAQINTRLGSGTYCISVKDVDGLPGPTAVVARITSSSAERPATGNSFTDTFASQLSIGGSAVKTFNTKALGDMNVTLASAATDEVLRLSLGAWDGTTCHLTISNDAPAGSTPQLAEAVDPGQVCVRVSDASHTGRTSFSLIVQHP